MGIAKDALMLVQAQMCERIDFLAAEMSRLSLSRLAHEVDALRQIAEANGLVPVVEIAHRLESELAASCGALMVGSFLEAMRDAVGCEPLDERATRTYLAAINQRLYG